MPTKLTKRVVEGAKEKSRDAFLWDTEIAGFGVKVTPASGRVYILQARLQGRKRRFTIGRHGSPGRWMKPARKRSDCWRRFAMGSTRASAEDTIAGYIDGFYNPLRRRSALDYLSPAQFEKRAAS